MTEAQDRFLCSLELFFWLSSVSIFQNSFFDQRNIDFFSLAKWALSYVITGHLVCGYSKKIKFKTIAPLSQESNEYFPFYFVFKDVNYTYFAQYLRVS